MATSSVNGKLDGAIREFIRVVNVRQRNQDVASLRLALAGFTSRWDRESVREVLLPRIARIYSCPLVEGQRKASGRLVLDERSQNFEAARKSLLRMLNSLFPSNDGAKSPTPPSLTEEISKEVSNLVRKYKDDPVSLGILKRNLKTILSKL
jgi:hypothetical protein